MTTAAAADYRHLLVHREAAVTILTVNRPQVLNALDHATLVEMERALRAFHQDDEPGVMILTGAGEKSFVSGADINELAKMDARGAEVVSRFGQRVTDLIERAPRPVIAAVNGYAFGGGCELALACHIRIASDNAVMGLPEVGLGIIPGYGGTQRLPRLVGSGRALEMILSGRRVKADEAEKIGLVNKVVPQADLLSEAMKLAAAILKNGPLAVSAALEAVVRGRDLSMDAALRFESSQFGMMAATEDMQEGMKAFLEKRPAAFRGK